MRILSQFRVLTGVIALVALGNLSACSWMSTAKAKPSLTLSGLQEVPPVTTAATGEANVTITADGGVSGTVTTSGFVATMAHIHMAPAGVVGPVIVPMFKSAEGVWAFADGAKLSPEQLTAYKAGNLYINVHSAANKGGELRGQLKP